VATSVATLLPKLPLAMCTLNRVFVDPALWQTGIMSTDKTDTPAISSKIILRTLPDHLDDFANELAKLPGSIEVTAVELRFAMLRALIEEIMEGDACSPAEAANQNVAIDEKLSGS
jgi:hypothetical protein